MGRPPKCHITCTIFNNETFAQHELWMKKYNRSGCSYGTPIQVSPRVFPRERMFVLEMNNDTNRVMGVGMIHNVPSPKRYKLYEDHSYNRYLYTGDHRIMVSQMTIPERAVIWVMEQLLFYGAGHMKRGQGISLVPRVWETNHTISFMNCLRQMFLSRFEFEPVPAELKLWDEGNVVNRSSNLLTYCGEERRRRIGEDDNN
jgi:hypothetical protein